MQRVFWRNSPPIAYKKASACKKVLIHKRQGVIVLFCFCSPTEKKQLIYLLALQTLRTLKLNAIFFNNLVFFCRFIVQDPTKNQNLNDLRTAEETYKFFWGEIFHNNIVT